MGGPRTSVGVCVLEKGSDESSVTAMLDENRTRTGVLPSVLLADANHAAHACIEEATRRGVETLISVPEHEKNARRPRKPRRPIARARAFASGSTGTSGSASTSIRSSSAERRR